MSLQVQCESFWLQKSPVLVVARVAGIMGVKKTSELIPMCHPLPIQKCAIDYELDHEKNRIHVFCTVKTEGFLTLPYACQLLYTCHR